MTNVYTPRFRLWLRIMSRTRRFLGLGDDNAYITARPWTWPRRAWRLRRAAKQ